MAGWIPEKKKEIPLPVLLLAAVVVVFVISLVVVSIRIKLQPEERFFGYGLSVDSCHDGALSVMNMGGLETYAVLDIYDAQTGNPTGLKVTVSLYSHDKGEFGITDSNGAPASLRGVGSGYYCLRSSEIPETCFNC
jgi:hypothetical protein